MIIVPIRLMVSTYNIIIPYYKNKNNNQYSNIIYYIIIINTSLSYNDCSIL